GKSSKGNNRRILMKQPTKEKREEWELRASKKQAIVPYYFEVFPSKVHLICGHCQFEFHRNLVPNLDEPTFVCPNENCKARNWIPLRYERRS
ncbi:MAG: hypothetical protein KDD60_12625, partial [Bdellovibrionales bacterium]|nr:hypothetical protein [Bdellovibrionales bacterium]